MEIDNPGGGNCGYHALAIGLIAAIQKEHHENKANLFKRWVDKGLRDVDLNELLAIKLSSPNSYKKLLNKLQLSLRQIAFLTYKEDLITKIKLESRQATNGVSIIEGSVLYGKFMELVETYLKDKNSQDNNKKSFLMRNRDMKHYNFLASCKENIKLAKLAAHYIRENRKAHPYEDFATSQKKENYIVKRLLLEDVLRNGEINANSLILKGTEVVTSSGRWWATHSDLTTIAEALDVNLLVNGSWNGQILTSRPSVKLTNLRNKHWTTTIEFAAPSPIASLENETDAKNNLISDDIGVAGKRKMRASQPQEENLPIGQSRIESEKNYDLLIATTFNVLLNSQGLFASHKKIAIKEIDTAKAAPGESDGSFAWRLQEAEFRRNKQFARRLEEASLSQLSLQLK